MKKAFFKCMSILLAVVLIFQFYPVSKAYGDYNGETPYSMNINGTEYKIQKFLSSGTFIVPEGVKVIDLTVVGGGGIGDSNGKNSDNGSGGGGGGYVVNQNNFTVIPGTTYSITVGNGGFSSSFGGIFNAAAGVRGMGSVGSGPGGNGGSGGGGGAVRSRAAAGSGGSNGNSGIGSVWSRPGTGQGSTTMGVDQALYGGGGGGGGCYGYEYGASGGAGGGGKGGNYGGTGEGNGTDGAPNTGGGGGGGGEATSVATIGGNGGSGIVIVRWLANVAPEISVASPSKDDVFSDITSYNKITLKGTVRDANVGDIITTKYDIDGGTAQTVEGTVTANGSFTDFASTDIDVSSLAEGSHNLNVWSLDNNGRESTTTTIPFVIDKTAPVINSFNVTSSINNITASGTAEDSVAKLGLYPYRFTISGFGPTDWLTSPEYTSEELTPNTRYTVTYEVRDNVGNTASTSKEIYTKAKKPEISAANPKAYSVDLLVNENNPTTTEYEINVTGDDKYVTPEGTLTTSPVWVTLPDRKITVQGLSPQTAYTFQVKARNGDGIETEWSSQITATTQIAPPGSPAEITATATEKTITIKWEAVGSVSGYDLEIDGNVIDVGTATEYTIAGLNPGTVHTLRVRGRNEGGPGSWSSTTEKSTLPASPGVPGNFSAVPQSTSIIVTWDNVPGATGYDIEADGQLVSNGPNTNYRHTSLKPGEEHSYRVRSINPGGKSEWSDYIKVATLSGSIEVPININAAASKNEITITWDAVDGATGYEIEVDDNVMDNYASTTFTHKELDPDTEHRYRVRARKGAVHSDWSTTLQARTLMDVFGTPVNFKAEVQDTSITLKWDPVMDAVKYEVVVDEATTVNNGIDTDFIHEGLLPNSHHTYKVRAVGATEESEWTELLECTTFFLPSPKNLDATADETSINATWDVVTGASGYDLELDGQAATYDETGNEYLCEDLIPGTQHILRVKAKNSDGESNWSLPFTISTLADKLNTPVLSGIVKKSSITVIWRPINGAIGYELEADGTLIGDITGTSYSIPELSPGSSHTYRVRVKYEAEESEWSDTITIATLAEKPEIPTNVAASSNKTSILLSWDSIAGAEGYDIEVDGVIVENGTGTSYLHNNLSPDTEHSYRVRAINKGGCSDWSGITTVMTASAMQEYTVDCTTGEEFNLVVSADGIQSMERYTFTVKYNPEDFDAVDLCALTAKLDTNVENITGSDIKIVQYEPGTIVFTKTGPAQTYEIWSGIVNSIRMKAKHDGQLTITYSINFK